MDAKSAKEFLRCEPPDGASSVHDHLVAVLQKLIVERPADANALFEEISASVRVSASKAPPRVPGDDEVRRAGSSRHWHFSYCEWTDSLTSPVASRLCGL